MAKPNYKVYVANLVTVGTRVSDKRGTYYFDWDQKKLTETVDELKDLFKEVCKSPLCKFAAADVEVKDLTAIGTSIKPGELLIRFTTKSDSIVVKKYGSSSVGSDTEGATKDTGSGVVSEAWLEGAAGSNNVPELVARLAFHELMHNKLDASNSAKDIHNKPDDGTGLAVSPVAYNTSVSPTNAKNMAPALGSIVNQFTGASIP